tara:strand:+ start:35511 stop:36284 length:774 start_codon:yes stop_codon:yes gene_type:complete
MSHETDVEMFDVDSIDEENALLTPKQEPTGPAYGSKEWNDHVMSLFYDNELIDGNPICAGLRRVAEDVLGSIVSSRPSQVFPSQESNGPGRATVVFEVIFDWMDSGTFRTFSDVADVWHGNTDDLFCAHPVATASTRAEGRALRKALKVRCLAAEELAKKDIVSIVRESVNKGQPTTGEFSENDGISSAQVNFLDNKCKQLDINVLEFINIGKKKYDDVSDITKKSASSMLGVLNQYQSGEKEIPENIQGYNKNWRD